MSEQEKLRNTLRDYYDHQEVPYNQNDWEKASAFLSAARRKRRMRYPLIVFGVLLFVSGIVLFNASSLSSNERQKATLNSSTLSTSGLLPQKALAKESASNRETTSISKINSKQTARKPVSESIAKSNMDMLPDQSLKGILPVEHEKLKEKEEQSERQDEEVIQNEKEKPDENINENGEQRENRKQGESENRNENERYDEIQGALSAQQQTGEVVPDTSAPMENASKESDVEDKNLIASLNSTSNAVSSPDTVATQNTKNDESPYPQTIQNLAGEGVFYEAGLAWLYGWKGAGKRDARGLSPVAGINYMNRLSNHCAFSFGLGYLRIPKLSNSSKTSRVSSYVYGEHSTVTVIAPSSVHYLLAPLRLHCHLDRHNSVTTGVNLAYLLNVDAAVTTYDEKPGYTGNYKTITLAGYTQGFSWYDSQVSASYTRKIGKTFGVQVEVFMGLIDVKQDDFFGFSAKERNSGVKLSVSYYAFRKNSKQ